MVLDGFIDNIFIIPFISSYNIQKSDSVSPSKLILKRGAQGAGKDMENPCPIWSEASEKAMAKSLLQVCTEEKLSVLW
ncbi:hypothetical protein [Methanosarcina sp. WH1]|uniref:hypothetical protein n=1 Tax=Methanosarcina sp. WH1 TaxID=1434102 RepID=UPI000615570A|nr:hypothetical protein [Methanosarcina sp. WH1]AKB22335.1 hypothetical protein MSWH1_2064 [Methanosarcina sp. WH1]